MTVGQEDDVFIEGDYDEIQKELMKETIVVVDDQDKVLGFGSKKACKRDRFSLCLVWCS